MASFTQKYCADFFKKNQESSNSTSSEDILEQESKIDLESENVQSEDSDDDETSTEIEESDDEGSFNNEDRLIARLYREVVDHIMDINNMVESKVIQSIDKMKEQIHQGHKKGFRRFGGIDFCKPSNRCGYLRRYAACHTGLVKKVLWRFFLQKGLLCKLKTHTIFNTEKLKVVSLGGGPGNDLVGFCSALQETRNHVNEIDFKIIDISQGWVSMFPTILRAAKSSNFGSLSKLLKRVKITTSFMQADLNKDDIFEDKNLCSVLGEADLVLMVKLVSFISDHEAETLIQNVVDAMQVGSLMIFIDQPFDKKLFDRIQCLLSVYHHYQKYELSFNPLKYHCPAISSSQAHIGVFKKFEILSDEDYSSSD